MKIRHNVKLMFLRITVMVLAGVLFAGLAQAQDNNATTE